ncbi:CobQ/CobB/MinD/ParA nucleotide binding protein, partial [human gut metagenome]
SSINFKKSIENQENYIAYFPDKELITRSVLEKKPIVSFKQEPKIFLKEKNFFQQFIKSCKAIKDA